ncbi:MAG: GFA family protein [Pseudomonadota bacterium]
MTISGECFCGDVKYQISGPLTDPRSCHCSRCRKAFSSQASHYALVNPEDFVWLQGEDLLTSYVGEPGFGLRFCSVCGSTLCGTFAGQVHGITLGTLNEEPELAEVHHIYVESKAGWETLPANVTTFAEGRDPQDLRDQ